MSYKFVDVKQVTIANGAALSDAIDVRGVNRLTVHMPDTWTAADIGFDAATEVDGTYLPVSDATGTLLIIDGPVADEVYTAPVEIEQLSFIKLRSNTAGTDENQGAERVLTVELFRSC